MEKTEKNGKTENKIFHPMISKKQKLHEANISVFSEFFRFFRCSPYFTHFLLTPLNFKR